MDETFGFYVGLIYFITYAIVFFIASIYCTFEVQKECKFKQSSKTFIKLWAKSLWTKKAIYMALVPHLFDQATDLAVICRYYELWELEKNGTIIYSDINIAALFFCSIATIVVHKLISCIVIYSLSKSLKDTFLQFLDLMMVKAIWLNYKLQTDEPGNAQRLLQLIEGTFESGPQIFISLVFTIKANEIDPVIALSLVSSMWTLTSRISSDDKSLVGESWQNHEFSYKSCPIMNWKYMYRRVGRFVEVTNRITLIALIWVSVGGYGLGVILGVELIVVLTLSIWSRNIMILGTLLYFYWGFTIQEHDNRCWIRSVQIYLWYKYSSSFLYLILITTFASIKFEASKVEEFDTRHTLIIKNSFGKATLIYCWISSILVLEFVRRMDLQAFKEERGSPRDFQNLIKTKNWLEAANLVSFAPAQALLVLSDGTVAIQHAFECNINMVFEAFIDGALVADKRAFLDCIARPPSISSSSLPTVITYLVDHPKVDHSDFIALMNSMSAPDSLKHIIEGNQWELIIRLLKIDDLKQQTTEELDKYRDDLGHTALHRLFSNCKNITYLMNHPKVDHSDFVALMKSMSATDSLKQYIQRNQWELIIRFLKNDDLKQQMTAALDKYRDDLGHTALHRLFSNCKNETTFQEICDLVGTRLSIWYIVGDIHEDQTICVYSCTDLSLAYKYATYAIKHCGLSSTRLFEYAYKGLDDSRAPLIAKVISYIWFGQLFSTEIQKKRIDLQSQKRGKLTQREKTKIKEEITMEGIEKYLKPMILLDPKNWLQCKYIIGYKSRSLISAIRRHPQTDYYNNLVAWIDTQADT